MADYNSSYTGAEIDEGVGNGLAAPTTYAPIDHAASASTYGKGTNTKYGHLMLSDSTSSTSSTSDGVAATPAAVKAAYDLANGKQAPLTFDNSPTQNSDNPVKSGGVYTALGAKADKTALDTFIRPNLLYNWYFVGGGSQQGGGQFPINTRGQTSWGENGDIIDRWKNFGAQSTSLQSDCLRVALTNGDVWRRIQYIHETPSRLNGKTVTASIMYKTSSTTARFNGVYRSSPEFTSDISLPTSPIMYNVSSKTFTVPAGTFSDTDTVYLFVYPQNTGESSQSIDIAAVKLEIGDTQTLAHQENGEWVLNETPDYNEQMLRCNEGLGQFAQVEYGSYTGTGTYGSTNANSLTFPFVPKFLLVKQEASSAYSIVAANGLTSVYSDYSTTYSNTMTWSDKTVTWYSTSAQRQLNTSATVYHYVAVG